MTAEQTTDDLELIGRVIARDVWPAADFSDLDYRAASGYTGKFPGRDSAEAALARLRVRLTALEQVASQARTLTAAMIGPSGMIYAHPSAVPLADSLAVLDVTGR